MKTLRFLAHSFRPIDILLVVGVAIALWSVYLSVQPSPLEYRNVPFPVDEPEVRAGEVITLTVDRCNHSGGLLIYEISRVLVNAETGARTQLGDSSSFMDPGCERITSKINAVPLETPAGRYWLDAVSIPHVGSRTWTVRWSTSVFKVVK